MHPHTQALLAAQQVYRKRRSVFRSIWGTISEGLDGKEADLFEEMGVEGDAAAGYDAARIERFLLASGGGRGGGVQGGGGKRLKVSRAPPAHGVGPAERPALLQ